MAAIAERAGLDTDRLGNDRICGEGYGCHQHVGIADSAAAVSLACGILDQRDATRRKLAAHAVAGFDLPGAGEDEGEPALRWLVPVGRSSGLYVLEADH